MSLFNTLFTLSRASLLLSASLVLGACASVDPQPEPFEQAPIFPGQTLPDGSVRLDTTDARIAQLWSASEQSAGEGDEAQALEFVYQALELDPQNSLLWSRAAEIQLDNDQPAQAENFAVKSNLFANDNRGLLYRNWLIIEHARDIRGDLLGARSAKRKVQEFKF